jgi:Ring finger domain
MRRHQSLPASASGSSILLKMSKSNPYVGTFRHSPPTSLSWEWKAATQERIDSAVAANLNGSRFGWMDLHKNSPYVGTKRHAPSSSRHFAPSTVLEVELCRLLFEQSFSPKTLPNGLHQLKDIMCGHLRGGGPYPDRCLDWQHQYPCKDTSSSASGTVTVLTRLLYWIVLPFQDSVANPTLLFSDSSSSSSSSSSHSSTVVDECSSILTRDYDADENSVAPDLPYDDDCSYTAGNDAMDERNIMSSQVLSSQAEAYYAHQAVVKQANEIMDQDHRLDYTITQMDVMRMMRNASRHLDVDSIVRLPVFTYKKEVSDPPAIQDEESWCLLQPQPIGSNGEVLIVPPQREVEFCVICLEEFEDGDRLRVLPCDHSFHDGCISKWLSGSHSFDHCFTSGCPTCRKRPDFEVVCPSPDPDVVDGTVPAWAFSRIGDVLSRNG